MSGYLLFHVQIKLINLATRVLSYVWISFNMKPSKRENSVPCH